MVKVADIRERSYSYTPLLTTFEDDSPGSDFFQQRRITHGYCAPNSLLQIGPDHWPNPRGRAPNLPGIAYLRHCKRELVPTAGQHRGDLPKLRSQSHMSPVGSKIIALFIGCYAVKDFRNVLLIDDDCILPPNFPVVVSRLNEQVRCIGYMIKSVGPDSSLGSYCQQAQDLEYKLSGLTRCFAGRIGSATFPHGAISLWERSF